MFGSESGERRSASADVEIEADQIDHVLGEEYEHKPVPLAARRSLFSATMVWTAFR
jgi:cytosine permease